jgi:hypothetical protein
VAKRTGRLGVALGAARDWDVLATETLPPVLKAFGDAKIQRRLIARAARRRRRERDAARAAVRSRQYAGVVLDLARWLALEETAAAAAPAGSLDDFASRIIRKRHKRLVKDAARLQALSVAQRHRFASTPSACATASTPWPRSFPPSASNAISACWSRSRTRSAAPTTLRPPCGSSPTSIRPKR